MEDENDIQHPLLGFVVVNHCGIENCVTSFDPVVQWTGSGKNFTIQEDARPWEKPESASPDVFSDESLQQDIEYMKTQSQRSEAMTLIKSLAEQAVKLDVGEDAEQLDIIAAGIRGLTLLLTGKEYDYGADSKESGKTKIIKRFKRIWKHCND